MDHRKYIITIGTWDPIHVTTTLGAELVLRGYVSKFDAKDACQVTLQKEVEGDWLSVTLTDAEILATRKTHGSFGRYLYILGEAR